MNNLNSQLRRCLIRVLRLVFENNGIFFFAAGSPALAMRFWMLLKSNAFRFYGHIGAIWIFLWQSAFVWLLFPDRVCFSFSPLFRMLQLLIGVIGVFKLFKVLHKENLLECLRPAGKLYHLWFAGVSPPALA
jgi:hypothetical protein